MTKKKIWYSLIIVVVVIAAAVAIIFGSGLLNHRSSRTSGAASASGNHNRQASRTLVVYYSLTGNTNHLARLIHSQGNITLARIRTTQPYSADTAVARVTRESGRHQYDSLRALPDLSHYDTILVGFPIWSNDVAYPVQSFLAQNRQALSGKRIVPFSTSSMAEAAAIRQAGQTIRRLAPDSQIGQGLNLTESTITSKRVRNWLNRSVFTSQSQSQSSQSQGRTAITLTAGNQTFQGYLNNSQAAKDLVSHLPLSLNLSPFAGGYPEKSSHLSFSLNTKGMPGHSPKSGDIDFFTSSRSVFVYHGSVGHFAGLHNIGHITSSNYADFAKSHDSFDLRIQRAGN